MTPAAHELVLEHLRELAGREVNATELSQKLGLSPAELHAAVEVLRERGYDVHHVDRPGHRGYALAHEPARPLDEEILALLPSGVRIGRPLVYREECPSTNDLAKEEGEAGAPHGLAVVTRRQTRGRGRRGRSWLTLTGDNLYASVLLRPELPVERIYELTMVAGVALAEALETCGVAARMKWPNDLEIDDRKVAGILAELATDAEGAVQFVVLGVGVNVISQPDAFPDEIRSRATSVSAHTDRRVSVAQVAAAFFEELDEWLVLHRSMGFEMVLDTWRARSSMLGAEVRALVDGQAIAGVAEELDTSGALLVRDAAGKLHRIVAGEITTLRRADRA